MEYKKAILRDVAIAEAASVDSSGYDPNVSHSHRLWQGYIDLLTGRW